MSKETPDRTDPTAQGSPRARKLHLRGVLRVAAFSFVVSTAIGLLAMRSAYGDIKESALIVGRQLVQFQDLVGRSHRVRLNGEPLYVASAVTDQPVDTVLDRFEQDCEQNAGAMKELFEQLPEALQQDVRDKAPRNAGIGIIRQDEHEEGYIACLAQRPGEDITTLSRRLQAFVETGDLAQVGDLRYAYAKRRDGASKTHVVTVWSEGPFKIGRIIPPDGTEPPGADPAHAPRPIESVRMLSAEIDGAPYAVRLYDSRKTDKEVLAAYDAQMPQLGWQVIPYVADEVPYSRAYSRDGVDMLVFAFAEGDKSYVSIVESSPKITAPVR